MIPMMAGKRLASIPAAGFERPVEAAPPATVAELQTYARQR
jgi:hypothetical protein